MEKEKADKNLVDPNDYSNFCTNKIVCFSEKKYVFIIQ